MPAYMSLAGRTALVTGASSGIGAQLAKALGGAGARVALTARHIDLIERQAAELRAAGHEAIAVRHDVTDADSTVAAFDEAERALGPLDTVIANAGIATGGRSTELDASVIRGVLDTNLLGAYLTAREAAKRMIASGSGQSEAGRIMLIGSITAGMTGQGDAAYAASKAAVDHLGRQFAREWVRLGINVNTIQPGYIRTELSGDWFETPGGRAQIAGWHRRRIMPIDALDDLAIFLCSDAARHVTGATFTIDDGQSL